MPTTAERRPLLAYADSSALVKLVVAEAETSALRGFLSARAPTLVTSRVALVEVARAAKIARPGPDAEAAARSVVSGCVLVDVTRAILDRGAAIADAATRSLDAVHLASALDVEADMMIVYDSRLAAAAEAAGLDVLRPTAA